VPILDPNDPRRRDEARARRQAAADLAFSRTHPPHEANEDEDTLGEKFPMNFTKGLPHDPTTGLINRGADYRQFVKAIFSGDRRDFRETPLGHAKTKGNAPAHVHCAIKGGDGDDSLDLRSEGIARLRTRLVGNGLAEDEPRIQKLDDLDNPIGLRAWESQSAGLAFDLEGPDAQAVTMPPAPGLTNSLPELGAEMAEVYAQALLRDLPFEYLDDSVEPPAEHKANIEGVLDAINELRTKHGFDERIIGYHEDGKPITVAHLDGDLTLGTLFRGITPGDLAGPYLSQFLLVGNGGVNGYDAAHDITDGQVTYGAIRADQRVRYAEPCVDYMTTWPEWYSVQCAADVSKLEIYADQVDAANVSHRLMATRETCPPMFTTTRCTRLT